MRTLFIHGLPLDAGSGSSEYMLHLLKTLHETGKDFFLVGVDSTLVQELDFSQRCFMVDSRLFVGMDSFKFNRKEFIRLGEAMVLAARRVVLEKHVDEVAVQHLTFHV